MIATAGGGERRAALRLPALLGVAALVAGAGRARAAGAESLPPVSSEAAPPPAPPTAGDQLPAPVASEPAAEERAAPVTVGASFGVVLPLEEAGGVRYEAAPTWGGWARLEVAPWLGWRLGAEWSRQPVTAAPGALLPEGTSVALPSLRVAQLYTRAEPTWVFSPAVRAWLGLGVGWSRAVAPPPTTRGALALRSAERSGVHLAWALALGAGFRPGPSWLELGAELGAGVASGASGSLYDRTLQGFDASDGTRHSIGPLPAPGAQLGGSLWVGVAP